ncbi:hypothetical protein ACYULU_00930 [Breznakiellaceae bacterium SP9]
MLVKLLLCHIRYPHSLLLPALLLFCTGASLCAFGSKDKEAQNDLAAIDRLIEQTRYDEAMKEISKLIKKHPEYLDAGQERLAIIMAKRNEYYDVAEALLYAVDHEFEDYRKIQDLRQQLEELAAANHIEYKEFLDQVQMRAQKNIYTARLNTILEEGRRLLAAKRFAAAYAKYTEGLELYQEEFFGATIIGQPAKTELRRSLSSITSGLTSFQDLAPRVLGAIQARSGDASRVVSLYEEVSPSLDELIVIKNTLAEIGTSLNKLDPTVETAVKRWQAIPYIGFVTQLVLGRERTINDAADLDSKMQEGMIGALDGLWNTALLQLEAPIKQAVDQSYTDAINSLTAMVEEENNPQAALAQLTESVRLAAYPLLVMPQQFRFWKPNGAVPTVINAKTIRIEDTVAFVKYRAIGASLALLQKSAALTSTFQGLIATGFPALQQWRDGTLTQAQATKAELENRSSFAQFQTDVQAYLLELEQERGRAAQNRQSAQQQGFNEYLAFVTQVVDYTRELLNKGSFQEFAALSREYAIGKEVLRDKYETYTADGFPSLRQWRDGILTEEQVAALERGHRTWFAQFQRDTAAAELRLNTLVSRLQNTPRMEQRAGFEDFISTMAAIAQELTALNKSASVQEFAAFSREYNTGKEALAEKNRVRIAAGFPALRQWRAGTLSEEAAVSVEVDNQDYFAQLQTSADEYRARMSNEAAALKRLPRSNERAGFTDFVSAIEGLDAAFSALKDESSKQAFASIQRRYDIGKEALASRYSGRIAAGFPALQRWKTGAITEAQAVSLEAENQAYFARLQEEASASQAKMSAELTALRQVPQMLERAGYTDFVSAMQGLDTAVKGIKDEASKQEFASISRQFDIGKEALASRYSGRIAAGFPALQRWKTGAITEAQAVSLEAENQAYFARLQEEASASQAKMSAELTALRQVPQMLERAGYTDFVSAMQGLDTAVQGIKDEASKQEFASISRQFDIGKEALALKYTAMIAALIPALPLWKAGTYTLERALETESANRQRFIDFQKEIADFQAQWGRQISLLNNTPQISERHGFTVFTASIDEITSVLEVLKENAVEQELAALVRRYAIGQENLSAIFTAYVTPGFPAKQLYQSGTISGDEAKEQEARFERNFDDLRKETVRVIGDLNNEIVRLGTAAEVQARKTYRDFASSLRLLIAAVAETRQKALQQQLAANYRQNDIGAAIVTRRYDLLKGQVVPALQSWLEGILTTERAIEREQGFRADFVAFQADAETFQRNVDTVLGRNSAIAPEDTRIYSDYAALMRGLSGDVKNLQAAARTEENTAAGRQYEIANREIVRRIELRQGEYDTALINLKGKEIKSNVGIRIAYYPKEAHADFTPILTTLESDVRFAEAHYNRYGTEPSHVQSYNTIIEEKTQTADYLARLRAMLVTLRRDDQLAQDRGKEADGLIASGQALFSQARRTAEMTNPSYEDIGIARRRLDEASEQFDKALNIQDSERFREQRDDELESLGALIRDRQNALIVEQVRKLLDDAQALYWREDYETALSKLRDAQDLHRQVNNEDDSEITMWITIVNGVMTVRERSLLPTSPLYREISQLLSEAKRNYDEGKAKLSTRREEAIALFNLARDKTKEIKMVFPLNQEAGMLELTMDQEQNPETFEADFKRRFEKARESINLYGTTFNESYADLLSLAELRPDFEGMQEAIKMADDVLHPAPVNATQVVARPQQQAQQQTQQQTQRPSAQVRADTVKIERIRTLSASIQAAINSKDSSRYTAANREMNELLRLDPVGTETRRLKDALGKLRGGQGSIVLDSESETLYQRAVRAFQQGNIIIAIDLVRQLKQTQGNSTNTRVLQLEKRINASL